ncbi:MAG: hypothetical protein HYX92_20660 [Chloroflexi bacterium]|nr:hypothetical protein [Chloroflexota bacterium]
MTRDYIEVMDPTSPPRVAEAKAASRLDDLDGRVIGFLWNRKPNGDLLLARIEERLIQRFNLKDIVRRAKLASAGGGSWPAPAELLDELAARCDLVVNAVGD